MIMSLLCSLLSSAKYLVDFFQFSSKIIVVKSHLSSVLHGTAANASLSKQNVGVYVIIESNATWLI